MSYYDRLVFVDCEAIGLGSVSTGLLTEFGAVTMNLDCFHGVILDHKFHSAFIGKSLHSSSRDVARFTDPAIDEHAAAVFNKFAAWLGNRVNGRPVFVSDNPAFDWQWINDGFCKYVATGNPFGHSARRIGDFYAGLRRDFVKWGDWKRYRRTRHDHNPVNDALGNAEAFHKLLYIAALER